jgi:cysteine desulfurase / selenocysteine lyase
MIYLNNCATTFPKPKCVIDAVKKYLDTIPFHAIRTGSKNQSEDIIYNCRSLLATFLNVKNPNDIIFTSSATASLNLAIKGLYLDQAHVITTAIEHNSVYRPLKHLERDGKIELSIINADTTGYVEPNDIASHIRENTSAIVVNHCSNVTGAILDIRSIAALAHQHHITLIVDASQSAGVIPIDTKKDNADIMIFTGHKSLYGIQGIGALYINENIKLMPFMVGGTGIHSDLLFQPEERPTYYEPGTPNVPGIVSLHSGIEYLVKSGLDHMMQIKQAHFLKIMDACCSLPEVRVFGAASPENRNPVFCFNIEGMQPDDVGYILEHAFNIIVRSGLHCAPLIHTMLGSYPHGCVRVSPSHFTTDWEIDQFIQAIKQICFESRKREHH